MISNGIRRHSVQTFTEARSGGKPKFSVSFFLGIPSDIHKILSQLNVLSKTLTHLT